MDIKERQHEIINKWIESNKHTFVKSAEKEWEFTAKADSDFVTNLMRIAKNGISIGRCQAMPVWVTFEYNNDLLDFRICPTTMADGLNYDPLTQDELHAWFTSECDRIAFEPVDGWLKTGSNIPDILKKLLEISRNHVTIRGFQVLVKSEIILDGSITFRLSLC